jgi:hypothetical protein
MKFFLSIILISSYLFLNWAYLYGVQDILEPSHQLTGQYSTPHILLPKNAYPNIAYSTWEIPSVLGEKSGLSISLPKYLHSMKVGTQRACVHGPYSQLPLEFVHSQNCIFVSTNLDSDAVYRLVKQSNDILSPIRYDNSNYLLSGNSFGSLTFNKTKTFIETKVTAMKLQGFNL